MQIEYNEEVKRSKTEATNYMQTYCKEKTCFYLGHSFTEFLYQKGTQITRIDYHFNMVHNFIFIICLIMCVLNFHHNDRHVQ